MSTIKLKEYARMRGFPQIVGIPPDVLMQQHRLADVWLTNTWEELVNLAKAHGCPVCPGSTHERLMTDLMNKIFGNLEEEPAAAGFIRPPCTTSADRATGVPPPHSAERSDDTLAAEAYLECERQS